MQLSAVKRSIQSAMMQRSIVAFFHPDHYEVVFSHGAFGREAYRIDIVPGRKSVADPAGIPEIAKFMVGAISVYFAGATVQSAERRARHSRSVQLRFGPKERARHGQ